MSNSALSRGTSMLLGLGALATCVLGTGGTVAYYEVGKPSTMNPLFRQTMADVRTQELVFDRLFYRSAITNELKSRIVTKWEKSGSKLKLTIKEGVKWHDGASLNATDVCFTVDALLDPTTPSAMAKGFREVLVGCEANDKEHLAVIELIKPYHNPRERVAFPILPKHKFDSTSIRPDSDFSSRPIGSGPMKGSRGKDGVKFTAYPNGHHNPRIGILTQTGGVDPLAQIKSLMSGTVHGIVSVAPPLRPDVEGSDDIALKSYDLRSWWFIALNPHNDHLSDPRVRQALDLTIDRDQLRELTIGVKPNDQNPPCEFISGPFVQSSPYYNRSVKVNSKSNRIKAAELMTAAGATKAAGRWMLDGAPITLRIGINAKLSNEATDLLNQVGNQLQEGGFDRQVYKVQESDWNSKAVTGKYVNDYDALIGNWSFGVVEDVNAMFRTRDKSGKGQLNIFNYSNAEVDTVLDEFDQARTNTEAQDAYHKLHELMATDLPYLFLWKLDTKSAWRNEVRNSTITPYYYFTEFDTWRL